MDKHGYRLIPTGDGAWKLQKRLFSIGRLSIHRTLCIVDSIALADKIINNWQLNKQRTVVYLP